MIGQVLLSAVRVIYMIVCFMCFELECSRSDLHILQKKHSGVTALRIMD
jgi:hypothetical protein